MSESIATPRTDALVKADWHMPPGWKVRLIEHARQLERELSVAHSARTPMTNGEIMEEFLDRDEAVWSLIDEVRAYRQGVGLTHSGRDPIEIITDKYFGISSREHIARTREMIAKAKSRRPTDRSSAK